MVDGDEFYFFSLPSFSSFVWGCGLLDTITWIRWTFSCIAKIMQELFSGFLAFRHFSLPILRATGQSLPHFWPSDVQAFLKMRHFVALYRVAIFHHSSSKWWSLSSWATCSQFLLWGPMPKSIELFWNACFNANPSCLPFHGKSSV